MVVGLIYDWTSTCLASQRERETITFGNKSTLYSISCCLHFEYLLRFFGSNGKRFQYLAIHFDVPLVPRVRVDVNRTIVEFAKETTFAIVQFSPMELWVLTAQAKGRVDLFDARSLGFVVFKLSWRTVILGSDPTPGPKIGGQFSSSQYRTSTVERKRILFSIGISVRINKWQIMG